MADQRPSMSPRTVLALVMGGLIVWGIYVAVGVLWYGINPAGAVLVLVCVGMFLAFWLLLLRTQNRDRQQ
jgi:ABC-type transport system involved in Fe-S cluster assembly fused permease/ATPase subunit